MSFSLGVFAEVTCHVLTGLFVCKYWACFVCNVMCTGLCGQAQEISHMCFVSCAWLATLEVLIPATCCWSTAEVH